MGDLFAQVLRDQALVTSRTGRQVGLMEGLLHQNITIAIGKASEKTRFSFTRTRVKLKYNFIVKPKK